MEIKREREKNNFFLKRSFFGFHFFSHWIALVLARLDKPSGVSGYNRVFLFFLQNSFLLLNGLCLLLIFRLDYRDLPGFFFWVPTSLDLVFLCCTVEFVEFGRDFDLFFYRHLPDLTGF